MVREVSVIIPSYCHEKYLEQAVRSVWEQSHQDIELLVIDDGSKDNSPALLQELEKESPIEMRVILKENEGLSRTLNLGLREAKGNYISILASDDFYHSCKLEKQVKFMKENPSFKMCYGRVRRVVGNRIENPELELEERSNTFEALLLGNFIPAVTVMATRDVLLGLEGFDEDSYIEDWDMWLKLSSRYSFGFLPEVLAYYRHHDSNSSSNHEKMFEAKKRILSKWEDSPGYSLAMRNLMLRRFRYLFESGLSKSALSTLALNPSIVANKGFWRFISQKLFVK